MSTRYTYVDCTCTLNTTTNTVTFVSPTNPTQMVYFPRSVVEALLNVRYPHEGGKLELNPGAIHTIEYERRVDRKFYLTSVRHKELDDRRISLGLPVKDCVKGVDCPSLVVGGPGCDDDHGKAIGDFRDGKRRAGESELFTYFPTGHFPRGGATSAALHPTAILSGDVAREISRLVAQLLVETSHKDSRGDLAACFSGHSFRTTGEVAENIRQLQLLVNPDLRDKVRIKANNLDNVNALKLILGVLSALCVSVTLRTLFLSSIYLNFLIGAFALITLALFALRVPGKTVGEKASSLLIGFNRLTGQTFKPSEKVKRHIASLDASGHLDPLRKMQACIMAVDGKMKEASVDGSGGILSGLRPTTIAEFPVPAFIDNDNNIWFFGFHGTQNTNAKSIGDNGLSLGKARPGLYGLGTYLATQGCKSLQYIHPTGGDDEGTYLIIAMNLGPNPLFVEGSGDQVSGTCHTATVAAPLYAGGGTQNHWEIIVHEDDRTIPLLRVGFSRAPKNPIYHSHESVRVGEGASSRDATIMKGRPGEPVQRQGCFVQ